MSRFALVLEDAGGTVPPMLALGDALVRLGHDVVVLSQPSVRTRAESLGCTFVPLSDVDDYDHRLAIERRGRRGRRPRVAGAVEPSSRPVPA